MAHTMDEDEISLREIFWTLKEYKISIILSPIIFITFAMMYAYSQPKIYTSSATVEVGIESKQHQSGDNMLAMAFGQGQISLDTEIEIIKSRSLTAQALSSVDFSHHYYTIVNFKKYELYKASPFEVNLTKGFNKEFTIHPYSATQYRLETNAKGSDRLVNYGDKIETKKFAFILKVKKDHNLTNKSYKFKVLDHEKTLSEAQKNIQARMIGKNSNIIKISKSDNVPLRAQEFANALCEAYISRSIFKKTREASQTLSFIDKELKKINDNLNNSAVKLENFKKDFKTVNMDVKAQYIMERLGKSESKLTALNIQIGIINSLYEQVKSGRNLERLSASGLYNSLSSQTGGQGLTDMIKSFRALVMKSKTLQINYTQAHPELVKLKREIKEMKSIIIEMIKNAKSNFIARKKYLKESIAKQQKLIEQLPENERIFAGLKRKFMVNEKIYSFLLEKQAASAIAKASTVSKNSILDRALYPHYSSKPNKPLIVIVGFIFGLIFGIVSAFIRDFLNDTIKSIDDIKHRSDVIHLGSIPRTKNLANSKKLKIFDAPKSLFSESFRNIRTNLMFMRHHKSSQVIMITSSIAGEGKTTISSNLAGIVSMTGKSVIMINLDLRKSTLYEGLDVPDNQGISSVLSGHCKITDVIHPSPYDSLDFISSGPLPPNPSELIGNELLSQSIEKLKERYDVIIIDTPPVALVTDARLLISLCDVVLFVVRINYTKKSFLKMINELSQSENMSSFGVIVNNLNPSHGIHGDYYEKEK